MESDMAVLEGSPSSATEAGTAAASEPVASSSTETSTSAEPATPAAPATDKGTEPAAEPTNEIEWPEGDGADEEAEPVPAEPEPGKEPDATGPKAAIAAKVGTAALTNTIKETPELASLLDANPRVKAQLYQMARRSGELAEFQELIPTPTRAREVVGLAESLGHVEAILHGDDPQSFWQMIYEGQMRPDPATGQKVSSGAYERHVGWLHDTFLGTLAQRATAANNQELAEAVSTIRDALGKSPSSPAKGGPGGEEFDEASLPPHIRQQLQAGKQALANEEQSRTRRAQEEARATEQFHDDTASKVADSLTEFVNGLLSSTRLSDYDKEHIARDFIEAVAEKSDADTVHAAAIAELLRAGGNSQEAQKQVMRRVMQWARQNGRDILEPILTRAGASMKQRQAARDSKNETRNRPDPRSTGGPARVAQPNATDLVKSAQQKLGRRLTDREILELA